MSSVYRVIPTSDWLIALSTGRVPMCGSDQRAGAVHLATDATVLRTADLYFSADEAPLALELDAEALKDALVWDKLDADAHGPKLVAEGIPRSAVRAYWVLQPADDGTFGMGVRHTVPPAGGIRPE